MSPVPEGRARPSGGAVLRRGCLLGAAGALAGAVVVVGGGLFAHAGWAPAGHGRRWWVFAGLALAVFGVPTIVAAVRAWVRARSRPPGPPA